MSSGQDTSPLQRLLAYATPASARGDTEEEIRAGVLVISSLTLGSFALFFALLNLVYFKSPIGAAGIGVFGITCVLTLFLMRWSKSTSLTGHWLTLSFFSLLALMPLIHGGPGAPSLIGMIILPIWSSFVLGRRWSAFWTALGAITVMTTWALGASGVVTFAQVLTADQMLLFTQSVIAAAVMLAFLLTLNYEHIKGLLQTRAMERDVETEAIVNATADAILTFSKEGALQTYNVAAVELLDLDTSRELTFHELVYDEDGTAIAGLDKLEGHIQSAFSRRHDGGTFPVEFSIRRFEAGGQPRYVVSLRDVSAKYAQQVALERAYQKAIDASQAKSQFLANMSHELRTPLNAIIGYSELIREESEEITLEDALPDLDRIEGSARHLLTLISEILDLSKIEAGKMDVFIEEFDVSAVLDDVLATITPLARERGNEVTFECEGGLFKSDRTKVRQILINLGTNAAKFTQDGTITIRAKRIDDGFCFEVEDTGIGISQDKITTLFDAFNQGDNSVRRVYGGTGLGLTITRHLTRMLKGSISVESEPGEGSTFSVTLAELVEGDASA